MGCSVSVRIDKCLYWPSDQDELFTFRDIEDVKVQENLVISYHEGDNSEDSLTFHYLAVDPLQVIMLESQGLLR